MKNANLKCAPRKSATARKLKNTAKRNGAEQPKAAPGLMNRRVKDLTLHPLNSKIYGDEADEMLVDSIKANGVLQPVLIDKQNRIISGHRRFDAATKAGLEEIPVTVFRSDDELDIKSALIEANRQRIKSNEQLAREAACLLEVEKEKASFRRSHANSKNDLPAKSPGDTGDAREVAGVKLGISGKTVDQSAAVVETIDRLREEGKTDDAEKLRDELNASSLNRAYGVALDKGWLKGSDAEKQKRLLQSVPVEQLAKVMARAKELAGADKTKFKHYKEAKDEICPIATSKGEVKSTVVKMPTWQDAIPMAQVRQWAKEALENVENNAKRDETIELLKQIITALGIVDSNAALQAA